MSICGKTTAEARNGTKRRQRHQWHVHGCVGMYRKAADHYRRRRNATEHDESGETKQKGDELQWKDGGRWWKTTGSGGSGRLTADRNGLRRFDVLCARSHFRGVGMLGAYQRLTTTINARLNNHNERVFWQRKHTLYEKHIWRQPHSWESRPLL